MMVSLLFLDYHRASPELRCEPHQSEPPFRRIFCCSFHYLLTPTSFIFDSSFSYHRHSSCNSHAYGLGFLDPTGGKYFT